MWKRFRIFKIGGVWEYIISNSKFVALCLLMMFGILIGSLSLPNIPTEHIDGLAESFLDFYNQRSQSEFFSIVLRSTLTSVLSLFAVYICGMFLFGSPLVIVTPFIRGLGMGLTCSYLYDAYGLKGTAFCLLILILPFYLSSTVLLFACQDAFDFSRCMFWHYSRNQTVALPATQLIRYHKRFVLYLLFTVLIGLIDGVFTFVFIHIFAF